jgi:hypothetical protein
MAGVPFRQTESVLRLERIRHVVPFQFFFGIKKQYCGIRAPGYVRQTQRQASAQDA